ncbi:aminodeoxychorismate lyase [Stutzerimonas chloritidismutans]|uniref:aminodeoxychorismate lyase n=1 Tax=Stutzerimonas chloritidismutans TaxID=203192 RepID=UPI003F174029
MLSWVNGQPSAGVPVQDRGLAYGDGLFETIRVLGKQPRLFERHLARLAAGCERLGITIDRSVLAREVLAFSSQLESGVVKVIVTRGDGQRGYAPPSLDASARRILLGAPAPAYPAEHACSGIRLHACAVRLAEQPALAGLKHLNRLEQVMARAEWSDASFAEGLMRDTSGRVIEGVFSNLFLVEPSGLITPALHRCGVEGVMRAELIERARRDGIAVRIEDVTFSRLLAAEEVFFCNSLYGIWPVVALEGHRWPLGPLTRKLQALISDLSSDA